HVFRRELVRAAGVLAADVVHCRVELALQHHVFLDDGHGTVDGRQRLRERHQRRGERGEEGEGGEAASRAAAGIAKHWGHSWVSGSVGGWPVVCSGGTR